MRMKRFSKWLSILICMALTMGLPAKGEAAGMNADNAIVSV